MLGFVCRVAEYSVIKFPGGVGVGVLEGRPVIGQLFWRVRIT